MSMSREVGADTPISKSDDEWRNQLSEEQYQVTRCGGTERAFTGPYWDNKDPGRYDCICCHTPLFSSDSKYDSGSGWPSFFEPLAADVVASREDLSHNMRRVETLCASCGAHLGHVFPDGPQPTGLRYCINGTALHFVAKE
jgi:peptide-methionine (R)-S-oxide reductase